MKNYRSWQTRHAWSHGDGLANRNSVAESRRITPLESDGSALGGQDFKQRLEALKSQLRGSQAVEGMSNTPGQKLTEGSMLSITHSEPEPQNRANQIIRSKAYPIRDGRLKPPPRKLDTATDSEELKHKINGRSRRDSDRNHQTQFSKGTVSKILITSSNSKLNVPVSWQSTNASGTVQELQEIAIPKEISHIGDCKTMSMSSFGGSPESATSFISAGTSPQTPAVQFQGLLNTPTELKSNRIHLSDNRGVELSDPAVRLAASKVMKQETAVFGLVEGRWPEGENPDLVADQIHRISDWLVQRAKAAIRILHEAEITLGDDVIGALGEDTKWSVPFVYPTVDELLSSSDPCAIMFQFCNDREAELLKANSECKEITSRSVLPNPLGIK